MPNEPAVLTTLRATMARLGISADGLAISYTEEFVSYPGGGYTNKQINVTAGGKTEHFSAELTEKNPLVTATEIEKYFGGRNAK